MSVQNSISPPKLPLRFLRWFCQAELIEDVEGDLTELFITKCQKSKARARLTFWVDVLMLFRPGIVKNFHLIQGQNHRIMFKNYYKTSIRSLMKNPLSSLINLVGLSAAIGVCIVAYSFNRYTFKIDQFHENRDEVYLVTFMADRDGKVQQNGRTPLPVGAMMSEDFAQIKEVCRIDYGNAVLKYEDRVFHERVHYVDPSYLRMLTFPLKWGLPASLNDVNSVILSEDMAVKYFGEFNPVGENIRVIFGENRSKTFKIGGVAMEFPGARSFDFDFLVNFENLKIANPNYQATDWDTFIKATIVQVNDRADLDAIEGGMDKYRELQNQTNGDLKIESFDFEPISSLYERSADIKNDISGDGFMTLYNSNTSFIIIGIFILALASINYINIAVVSATKRLKEIGLRKVIGASRRMVIVQFLAENMLVMLLALILGVVFGINLFIPWMEQNSQFDMDFEFLDRTIWIFLPSVLIFTAIVSGSYPALYISRFQAVTIFKGSFKLGKRSSLTRIFLGLQLLLAGVVISIAVVFSQNSKYQAERSWGYDKHEVIYASIPDNNSFEQLHQVMSQDANVISLSGSVHHLGKSNGVTEITLPDRQYEVNEMNVDSEYFKTLGIVIEEGRTFKDKWATDKKTLVVNETLVEHLGLSQPIGQLLKIDSTRYEVIGVVKDFHSYSFYTKVKPTVFKVAEDEDCRFLSMKVRPGTAFETRQVLQEQWASLFPEIPFDGGHQEDVWGDFEENMNQGSRFWWGLAIIVILIASLGLYGVVTLNVSGRVREFSIRKVLGAGLQSIGSNITKQYILVFGLSMILTAPASFALVRTIFDTFFVYHMPLSYSFFIFTSGILTIILMGVVIIQLRRVLKANPVDGLKAE